MRLASQNSFQNSVLLNERTSTILGGERFRYGYQGSEKDNEVKGEGSSYTTEFRQLDPRLGRWLTIDPKASSMPWQSPYCSMDNNPVLYNDTKGDSIRKTEAFKSDKDYMTSYDKFAKSKAGKKFIKDYDVGGKYEHVSVVFDIEKTGAGVGGRTGAYAVDKKTLEETPLNGSNLINSKNFAEGKDANNFVRFRVNMNKYHGSLNNKASRDASLVGDGANMLHEVQHVIIGFEAMMDNKSIPSSTEQHETMRDENQHYYWDRVDYWWQFTPEWYHDFLRYKEEDKDMPDTNQYKIKEGIDYIRKRDTFRN